MLSRHLEANGDTMPDDEASVLARQMLLLVQNSDQLPIEVGKAVAPLMRMLKARQDEAVAGNVLAALAALVVRSEPECDMGKEALELGALAEVERLMGHSDALLEAAGGKGAAEGERDPRLLGSQIRTNSVVLLHALAHACPAAADPVLAGRPVRRVGEMLATGEAPANLRTVCLDIFAHLVSSKGDAGKAVARECGILGVVSRMIAAAQPEEDAELSVRALLVAGLLLPERDGEGGPKNGGNLREMAATEGCVDGLVRLCRNRDSDCHAIAVTILREMSADEGLKDQVEAALQAAAVEIRTEREQADEAAAAMANAKLN